MLHPGAARESHASVPRWQSHTCTWGHLGNPTSGRPPGQVLLSTPLHSHCHCSQRTVAAASRPLLHLFSSEAAPDVHLESNPAVLHPGHAPPGTALLLAESAEPDPVASGHRKAGARARPISRSCGAQARRCHHWP